jgi:hypothetical protein
MTANSTIFISALLLDGAENTRFCCSQVCPAAGLRVLAARRTAGATAPRSAPLFTLIATR